MAPLLNSLASLLRSNSPDHNAKGTQSVVTEPKPCPTSYRLYACRFRISFTPRTGVLFTFPSRYSFTIGHTRVFRLGGWSPRFHARLLGSGVTQELHYAPFIVFAYRAFTVSGGPFQATSTDFTIRVCGSYNPAATRTSVWALPRSLAATWGISVDFSFHQVLRCFSSLGSLGFRRNRHHWRLGCPIRRSWDQSVCAAPPSLSQLTASFIAFVCQGILDMHSLA